MMKRLGVTLVVVSTLLIASAKARATGSGTWLLPVLGGVVSCPVSLGFGIANFVSATEHTRPGGGSLFGGYVSSGICALSGLGMLLSKTQLVKGIFPTMTSRWWALGGTTVIIGVVSLAATIAANSHSRTRDSVSAGAALITTPLLRF